MATKYKWAKGARTPKGVSAETAAAELDRVRRERGELTAHVLLDESRDPTAPLHTAFEWDDAKAAESHRLNQAQSLIRSVVIQVEDTAPECRAFTLVTHDDTASYFPTQEVVVNEDFAADALSRLRSQVAEANKSLREYMSLARHMGKKVNDNAFIVEESLSTAEAASKKM